MKLAIITSAIMLILIFNFKCYGQTDLTIEVLSKNEDNIAIRFILTNISSDTILFYKPVEQSICMSILNIAFIEVGNLNKHEYFPCEEIMDIDQIILYQSNSVLIVPKGSYSSVININRKNISPYLKKERYKLLVSLNYENGNFEAGSNMGYLIYRGTTISNEVTIINK